MITNIKLKNFRGFQDEISVRLRPITVLIGKNSAGKSSLIKFLLMLRQTLESQRSGFFVTDGMHVQLGTWLDVRNTQARARGGQRDDYCRFNLSVETEDLPPPEIQAMWQAMSRGGVVSTVGDRVRIGVEFPRQPVRAMTDKAQFEIAGSVHYGTRFKYGRHIVHGRVSGKSIFKKRADSLATVGFLRFAERTDSLNKLLEGVTAEGFLDRLREEFLTSRHLSPIREESQKAVQTGSPPPGDVGHRGEYAMPHLATILSDPKQREPATFISAHAEAVAKIDKVSFSRRVAELVTHIKARNTETQAVVSLADFGFGVSQCLPIFIQGAMHTPGQLLIVEQPEAQLHPTAQLEMGSFFAELWTQRRVPSLIETHSANIILRLQFHRRAMSDERQVLQWLRYVLEFAERVDIPVNFNSVLGKGVCQEMDKVHAERSDQIFVYVACALDSVMVSNNTEHVTGIRPRLRACARKAGSYETDFLSSTQADGAM